MSTGVLTPSLRDHEDVKSAAPPSPPSPNDGALFHRCLEIFQTEYVFFTSFLSFFSFVALQQECDGECLLFSFVMDIYFKTGSAFFIAKKQSLCTALDIMTHWFANRAKERTKADVGILFTWLQSQKIHLGHEFPAEVMEELCHTLKYEKIPANNTGISVGSAEMGRFALSIDTYNIHMCVCVCVCKRNVRVFVWL